jgi:raffinose/stachyose/melibiose transport system permease protein
MIESRFERIFAHGLLLVGAALALFPLAAVLAQALAPPGTRATGFDFSNGVSFENFIRAWNEGLFAGSLISSAFVALCVVVGTVVCSVLGGYALAMLRVPFANPLILLFMVGIVVPSEARIIPLYDMAQQLGILDTYWALILPQIAGSVSIGIFWMRIFFLSAPESLGEAASLDGATRFQVLTKVLLPLAWPAITTLSCLIFLWTWNEFMLALVLTPGNQDIQTAPLSLSYFAGNTRTSQPAVVAAAAVIVATPILVAYAFLQRRFIQGIFNGV